jgi:hypothetical protein
MSMDHDMKQQHLVLSTTADWHVVLLACPQVLDWGDQVNYIVMKTSNAISFQDLALRQTGYQAPYALGASVLPSLSALMWGVSIARQGG